MRFIKTKLFISFLSWAFLATSLMTTPVSADRELSSEMEKTLRAAWTAEDCQKAEHTLTKMQDQLPEEVYFFYKAEAFEFGYCVAKNADEAILNYKKVYEKSQSLGATHIAYLYLSEKNDPIMAQKWLRLLAVLYGPEERKEVEPEERYEISEGLKKVFIHALFGDRVFPQEEFEKALKWLEDLKAGPAENLFEYALIFEQGLKDYPAHEHASFTLLLDAAAKDYPPAAWKYAQQLMKDVENGKAHPFSPMNSLKTAAHGGIVEAQVQVGRTYRNIHKNERYLERAYEWFLYAQLNGANIQTEIEDLLPRLKPERATMIKEKIVQNGRIPK